jgi:hypothetical protein
MGNPIALFDTFNRVGVPAVLIKNHEPSQNPERRHNQRFTFSLKGNEQERASPIFPI